MADHADDNGGGDGDIFIYRGGRAPQHITHAYIDESVDEIEEYAFCECEHLVQVETHDGIKKVGKRAFRYCTSLQRINLKSVVEIEEWAFFRCENMESVEFGDNLETIETHAFAHCTSLQHLKLPSIITIGRNAFLLCIRLTDVELPERLETIGTGAFYNCKHIQRIAIPLKRDLFEYDGGIFQRYTQFDSCEQLTTVDVVGGIRRTVASLHMESWRTEMDEFINRINLLLPTIGRTKTDTIQRWMEVFMNIMDHYKAEHVSNVKEGITQLELALWKAKLLDESEDHSEEGQRQKVKVDSASRRKERRITCGADMVIKNVLPFLQLD